MEIRLSEELLRPTRVSFFCKRTSWDVGTLQAGVYERHKLHLRTGETWTNWMFWGDGGPSLGVSGRLEEPWIRAALGGIGVLGCESSSRY